MSIDVMQFQRKRRANGSVGGGSLPGLVVLIVVAISFSAGLESWIGRKCSRP